MDILSYSMFNSFIMGSEFLRQFCFGTSLSKDTDNAKQPEKKISKFPSIFSDYWQHDIILKKYEANVEVFPWDFVAINQEILQYPEVTML